MYWNPIPDKELQGIINGMEQAEKEGFFDDMFQGGRQEARAHPTRETLLSEIGPEMKLYRSFFMRIYGYELTWPGFAETALTALEDAGCSRAREYYSRFASEYEEGRETELKNAAKWLGQQGVKGKEGREPRDRKIRNMTRKQLTELCQRLLESGIIKDPSQFATAVLRGN